MAHWTKSQYPGLRYREHADRTRGVGRSKRPLRYYTAVYKWKGKTITEVFGWEGDFVHDEDHAYKMFLELKQNRKNNTPPFTLKERFELSEKALEKDLERAEQEKIKNLIFSDAFKPYLEYSKIKKRSEKGWLREEQLFRLHIKPVIGDSVLSKVAPIQLERMKKNMSSAGLSPRTIRYALATVRQVFNYAIQKDCLQGKIRLL